MRTLYISIMFIVLLTFGIVQAPIFAQQSQQNSSVLSYQECQNKIGNEMQKTVDSINKTKAILLAINSNEFQSKTNGYRYVYSDIFTNMTEDQNVCGDVKLTSIVIEFSILNNSSNFVKFIQVGENAQISQVTLVEDVLVSNCDNSCPPPSPPAGNIQKSLTSPLRQIASGVSPKDVKCRQDLTLIFRAEDNFPACVKPDIISKLVERGWTNLRFETGITINSYTPTSNDTTYLSQTVDEWKNKTPEQLNNYYKKYKDAFYDELGSFLIKDEMKKELARQNIQNVHDDFKVFPGMSLDSLPPHISYDAVVNATDGNSYLLLGGVFANKIESSPKIIKLVFDKNALHSLSTGNGPSYPDPSTNAHVDNSTSQERVQIAGTYIENSDIPWSSVGTGNYGVVQIGLYTSVYHMIPDAQKYYTARAMQLIPFYVPVKILPPPSTTK